ncbi:uncharacterized protein LOC131610885 [Vicia villosa]|uniref:uncharacterized protein LOC131610885 n=1 Tax=Vicia villosa TaxID=3911 RepID=UPI00273B5827|nr:uncharacterized protein LOC131610885 [Vicia villosa]
MFSTTTCALKVNTNCEGWSEIISKILNEIKDLNYNFNTKEGVIYISGRMDSPKIMKMITKHGNTVKLCWMKSVKQFPPMHMPMHAAGYPSYQRGFYPSPHPTPMPYYHPYYHQYQQYQYNNYDPMYGHHQHGYYPRLPYYY